jgi:hypothetical protein
VEEATMMGIRISCFILAITSNYTVDRLNTKNKKDRQEKYYYLWFYLAA